MPASGSPTLTVGANLFLTNLLQAPLVPPSLARVEKYMKTRFAVSPAHILGIKVTAPDLKNGNKIPFGELELISRCESLDTILFHTADRIAGGADDDELRQLRKTLLRVPLEVHKQQSGDQRYNVDLTTRE